MNCELMIYLNHIRGILEKPSVLKLSELIYDLLKKKVEVDSVK